MDDGFPTGVRPLVLDGGLATALEARGHDLSGALWSARLLADDPRAIEAVHRAFFRGGADVACRVQVRRGVAHLLPPPQLLGGL